MAASLLSYSYNISHPGRRIRYIQTSGQAVLQSQASYTALQGSFLGLDIEWRPNSLRGAPENRVALIQLASRHEVLLFHIYRVGQLPPVLVALLEDPDIKKVGVNIKGDVAKLHKDWNIDVKGAEDLSELAWEVDAKHWHAARNSAPPAKRFPIGLARLVERYLMLPLDKSEEVQRSDWEKVLNQRQRNYAANDAAAAYDLQEYFTMVKEGRVLLPPPMELNVDVGHLYLEGSHLGVSGVENKPVAPPAPKPHIPAPYPEDDGPFGQNPTFLPSPPKKNKYPLRKYAKRVKPRDKPWKGRDRDRGSLRTLEVLLRILFLLLSIYSVLICSNDTKSESAACRNLSVGRERIFDQFILPPIQFIANHPAVAPHIAHAKPHIKNAYDIVSTRYGILYKQIEVAARPSIIQLQREYNIRLRPQIRVVQYNWREYRRQTQPYINKAHAAGFHLWTRLEPYVTPVLAKVEGAPALASLYLVRPFEDAKQKWVDPQLRRIVERVKEMSASIVSEEASTVASAAKDTITPTTENLNGNMEASTTQTWDSWTISERGFLAPAQFPIYPTSSRDTGATDPNPNDTPDNSDVELEAFLRDLNLRDLNEEE